MGLESYRIRVCPHFHRSTSCTSWPLEDHMLWLYYTVLQTAAQVAALVEQMAWNALLHAAIAKVLLAKMQVLGCGRRFYWGIMCRLIYFIAPTVQLNTSLYSVSETILGVKVSTFDFKLTSQAQLKNPMTGAAYLTRVGWEHAALSLHNKKIWIMIHYDKAWSDIVITKCSEQPTWLRSSGNALYCPMTYTEC